jgi:dihydrofolate reductase
METLQGNVAVAASKNGVIAAVASHHGWEISGNLAALKVKTMTVEQTGAKNCLRRILWHTVPEHSTQNNRVAQHLVLPMLGRNLDTRVFESLKGHGVPILAQ